MTRKLRVNMWLTLGFAAYCFCLPAWAEKYALLVGVSQYPNLSAARQLAGASNDVKLMREVLGEKGFTNTNIQVLADGLVESKQATRGAILSSLQELALKVKTGDFVYLHFSLHGSQQPESRRKRQAEETDGMDEIILPADIGKWDGKLGAVTNAIIDDELHVAFNAIRRQGAFVFAVFDTCHAATMSRGGDLDSEHVRHVPSEELGIPVSAKTKSTPIRRGAALKKVTLENIPNMGGFVGFYASESDQTTPEITAPNKRKQGLFTFHLAQALRTLNETNGSNGTSYQQLAQSILHGYARDQRFFPTPIFEGNALYEAVFNQEITAVKRQWRVSLEGATKSAKLVMHAGKLHQFGKGSIFALVANPSDTEKELIGYARAESVDSSTSTLLAIPYRDRASIKTEALPTNLYARLVEPKLELNLGVRLPTGLPKTLSGAIRRIQNTPISNVVWGVQQLEADVQLVVDRHYVCLLPVAALKKCKDATTRIAIHGKTDLLVNGLREASQKLARSRGLVLLVENLSKSSVISQYLDVQLYFQARGASHKTIFPENELPILKTGDQIFLNIQNPYNRSVDLTSLIVDSAYGITTIYPQESGESNRLEPGAKIEIPLLITANSSGLESLVMIASEAEPHELVQDFSFLAQEKFSQPVSGSFAMKRIANESDSTTQTQMQWLAFADASQHLYAVRGEQKEKSRMKNQMRVFHWITK